MLMEGGAANASQTVITALTTAMQTVADNAMTSLSGVLPVAVPVFGAVIMIGIAIKVVKRFTGR